MRLYVDTSILVTALTNEVEAHRMQNWLQARSGDTLHISDWVKTEFSAALSIKLHNRDIALPERAISLQTFKRMTDRSFLTLDVSAGAFRAAARFADDHTTGLRAADALHLAIASENGLTLCTRDRRLAGAGTSLGVSTILL